MQRKQIWMHWCAITVLAFLTTFALGIDMSVELPLEVVAMQRDGFAGSLNNLIAAINYFHTMDHLSCAVMAAGCMWIYHRYLCTKAKGIAGEYIMSVFLAFTMLVSEGLVAEDTITCLWTGGTQMVKSAMYMAGITPLFLVAIRALKDGLHALPQMGKLSQTSLWAKHPFLFPFLIMTIFWLPPWLMKYPGGMSPDVTIQILDYQNQTMSLSHPPLTTVAYGWLYELGRKGGNANLGILLFTVLQTFAMLCVLSYSCVKMRQWNVSRLVYGLCIAIFCIVPSYSGYMTGHVKDVPYVIGCILLCILMIDFSVNPCAFVKRKTEMLLLILAGSTIWLWRRNGIVMVIVCGTVMMLALLRQQKGNQNGRFRLPFQLLAAIAATIVISLGTNAVLTQKYDYLPAMQREVYSHLLQMTGRVAKVHDETLPENEKEVIDRVMDYEKMVKDYNPIITDGVKFHFREDASQEDYAAYRQLVWKHLKEYPQEYLDAYLNLIYRQFDLRADRGVNVDRREISHPFYLRSYTNLLYNQEELEWLNAAQEAVENWHYLFPDLPFVGLLMNIGFCTDLLLVLCYVMWHEQKKRMIIGLLPALMTFAFCLVSPVVYIRYALPLNATLPFWFAAWCAHHQNNNQKEMIKDVS